MNNTLLIKIKADAQNKMRRASCARFPTRDVNEIYGTCVTFSFSPNIEPPKTIKSRFMRCDKLNISTCARHLTAKVFAHILKKKYDENCFASNVKG